jgi:hypothetical protein
MRLFTTVFMLIILGSCSSKFHGKSQLLGWWNATTPGAPHVYFDSCYYFFSDLDTTKHVSYRLKYRLKNEVITSYVEDITFSKHRIIQVSLDSMMLRDEVTGSIISYQRRQPN